MRLIGQYVVTTARHRALHVRRRRRRSADLSGSALFAYKLNWQTVLYLGYGDEQQYYDVTGQLEHSQRQIFAKVSYAWQH